MGVSIIRGGIASGKSRLCLEQIEKIHNENPQASCIMLVPDHYSYETERQLVERFGGTGLNNIEALTLRRMAINCLSARELNHLTQAGKQMLLRKAANAAREEIKDLDGMDMSLVAAMQKQGFLDIAASLVSELKRYLITPDELRQSAERIEGNRTLKNKLTALCALYEKYCSYVVQSGCTDSDDDLYALAEHIRRTDEFDSDTYIWINRFDKFMPHQLAVLEALLEKGVHMTVSVCCPVAEDESEREIYIQTEETVKTVMRLADIYGFEGETRAGKALSHLKAHSDLYRLFRYWTEDFEYEDKPNGLSLFQSRDTYGEIEHTACRIVDLVRDNGYRYRDIAILCGDEEDYRHIIEAVFSEYEIPYFTDRKIILSDHPIAMQLISLIGLIEDDWSYDAVFRYLRAGFIYRKEERDGYTFFAPIAQEEIDELENLVLKCGIRGKSRWLGGESWTDGGDIVGAAFNDASGEGENEPMEKLRRSVTAPVERFMQSAKGRRTAREFAEAVFNYLEDIHLYDGLKADIRAFKKSGQLTQAEQLTQLWNLILDVLNQTVTALGEDIMTLGEFGEYMSAGLSKCEIRTIPSAIDQVYVGSVERSSHGKVRAMFVIGAKNGTFPTGIKTEGFLSNKDRSVLGDSCGILLAPDTKRKMDEQYFKVYRALTAVTEKLYMSYSVQDEEGNTQSAAHMVLDIHRRFPHMEVRDNLLHKSADDRLYLSSPKATIHRMLINLSGRNSDIKNPLWDIVREWYNERDEWRRTLSLMSRADYYSRRGIMLDSDIAAMLYEDKITYSASRINTFMQCPFKYFLKYGLGAREREEWEVTPADMGSYAHRVINEFCLRVEKGAETGEQKISAWRALSDDRRADILNEIISGACDNILSSKVRDRERTAGILRRMGKTVSDAAVLVQKSLASGGFAENGMEYEFNIDLNENTAVRGIIDRLDTCTDGDRTYMRIIDYKTGSTEFNVVNIYNGCDMQMVIYALAAKQLMKERGIDADVAGIYYTAVRNKYRPLTARLTEGNIQSRNKSDVVLDGMTFAPDDDEGRARVAYNMDNDFFENRKCSFARIKLDKEDTLTGMASFDEIDGLMEHVKNQITDMDGRARLGDIRLNPYAADNRTACDYCDYSSVCRFDSERIEKREAEGTSEEIWEKMKDLKASAASGGEDDA